jgi:hypothetical protein
MYKDTVNDANLVAVTRTSPTVRNGKIHMLQPEKIASSGSTVLITFEAERYRSAWLGSPAKTFVRIEGFIK